MYTMIKFIDTDKEHHKILFDLRLLDDDEDWKLYQLQEKLYEQKYYDNIDDKDNYD